MTYTFELFLITQKMAHKYKIIQNLSLSLSLSLSLTYIKLDILGFL